MPRFIQSDSTKSKSNRTSDRHKLGVFYTPKFVATHALKDTLSSLTKGKSPKQLLELRIIDPSVGDGVFLETALEHILNCIEKQTSNFDRRKWALQIQKTCLFGVDINPSESHIRTTISSSNLFLGCNSLLSAWGPISHSGKPRSLSVLNSPETGIRASDFQDLIGEWQNLIESPLAKKSCEQRLEQLHDAWLAIRLGLMKIADFGVKTWDDFLQKYFLAGETINTAQSRRLHSIARKHRFFHWELRLSIPSFDLVCGNPPWEVIEVGDSHLDYLPEEAAYSSFVGEQYSVPVGRRIELAAAFTNLAFEVLDYEGQLSFILPSSINYAKTYEKVRQISFKCGAQFNRFDNSTGIFEGLDKRCDFTCFTVDFGRKKTLTLSSSMYSNSRFDQEDIKVSDRSSIRLLSGAENVVPNFRDRDSTTVIGKILSQCRSFESFNQEYDTWNGLNSTTDRSLLSDRKTGSNIVPVATGHDINTLSTLCSKTPEFKKWIAKADLKGRGFSERLDGNLWEFERLGWRKIARSDDTRTLIVSPIPAGVANLESLWSIAFADSDFQIWCEFIWSSLPFDAIARTVVNSNVSKFLLLGLPMPEIDKPTLKAYKILRQAFASVQYLSPEYYNLVRDVNTLAFRLFGLNSQQEATLIRSYFNPSHPVIDQITNARALGLGEAA